MVEITSAENKIYKHFKKLYQNASYRDKSGETVLEGERLVMDAARFGAKLSALIVREDYKGRVPEGVKTWMLSEKLFRLLADTESPQGIIASAFTNYAAPENPKGLLIFCDRITDPGNLGTIIRTAHAVGAAGMVLRKGTVNPFSPKVVRASMGSVFALPISVCQEPEIPAGYKAFCGALSEKSKSLYKTVFPEKSVIVLGNEANGASREVLALCEHIIIPMPGGTESLNVAAAGAVMMYEYVRQVQNV